MNNPWVDWGQHKSAQQISTTNDLEREIMLVGVDLDIFQYWKMHLSTYPTRAQMTRDILAVSASTLVSEYICLFSYKENCEWLEK
jgi:hypothetical protein